MKCAVCNTKYDVGCAAMGHPVAPSPQPPADAGPVVTVVSRAKKAGASSGVCGTCDGVGCRQCEPDEYRPAGPPVTGDGDAAELDRLVEDAVMSMNVRPYHSTRQAMDNLAYEAYAAGLARGRALGAREALDSLEATMKADLDHYALNKHAVEWIPHFLEAIEARRAGRGA